MVEAGPSQILHCRPLYVVIPSNALIYPLICYTTVSVAFSILVAIGCGFTSTRNFPIVSISTSQAVSNLVTGATDVYIVNALSQSYYFGMSGKDYLVSFRV